MTDCTPLPHQAAAIAQIDAFHGRVLLAWDMGLGKTFQTLWWLRHKAPHAFPALIVCPPSVKYNWEYECQKFIGIRPYVCEGRNAPFFNRCGFGSFTPQISIINYDILKDWTGYFSEMGIRTIVFDECQNIKDPSNKRTKAALELGPQATFRFGLSGTPILNWPIEIWPTLKILWPEEFEDYWDYATRYCVPKWNPRANRWECKGAVNTDLLRERLLRCGMLRLRKEDVLKDLPPLIQRVIPCDITDRDEYRKASTDFLGWLRERAAHKVLAASRAAGMTRLGYLLRLTGRLKFKAVVDWANRFLEETDEKLTLFAIHHKAIEALQRRVKAKHVTITGDVSAKERTRLVRQFQEDPSTRVFLGNQAAYAGITLTAASESAVVELPWRPGDLGQISGRSHRIGQTKKVFLNYLVAGGTIEEDICELLQRKQDTISSILDGTSGELDLYDELMGLLEKRDG